MNFVKSGVYVAEITEAGIKEQEIDTRDPREREEENRLKKLPEFSRGQHLLKAVFLWMVVRAYFAKLEPVCGVCFDLVHDTLSNSLIGYLVRCLTSMSFVRS